MPGLVFNITLKSISSKFCIVVITKGTYICMIYTLN